MGFQNLTGLLVLLATLGLVYVATADAAFIRVDTFEYLEPGPIDDQGGWYAEDASSEVVVDPADMDNQILSVITESTHLYHEALILNGTIRMLFLRFRYEDQLNFSMGMSRASAPFEFGDFDSELSMANSSAELRINDDGHYETLAVLTPGVWYNCWLLIDNYDDVSTVWLHDRDGEPATAADQMEVEGQTEFVFRHGGAGNLQTFYIKTGGGNGVAGPLYIDDIYLENTNALNLYNPANPATPVREMPAAAALADVYPNPFNPCTTITFSLPQPETATVGVYRLTGERIAELANRSFAAGEHSLSWNGCDDGGRAVSSGTYLVLLKTRSTVESRKMMLLK